MVFKGNTVLSQTLAPPPLSLCFLTFPWPLDLDANVCVGVCLWVGVGRLLFGSSYLILLELLPQGFGLVQQWVECGGGS